MTKRTKISYRLEALRPKYMKEHGDDDYAALDDLTKRINHLAPMARTTDREEEAEVLFLKRAVDSTQWGLAALHRTPLEQSYAFSTYYLLRCSK